MTVRRLLKHSAGCAACAIPIVTVPAVASAATPPGVAAFVRDRSLMRYTTAFADLDGDKQPEALVYAISTTQGRGEPDLCGSGGCRLYVLSLTSTSYRLVSTTSVARPPIRVLSTRTHGWNDLSVFVSGGGILPGYEAQLRFDGRGYPPNPTIPPATKLSVATGRQVIGQGAVRLPPELQQR